MGRPCILHTMCLARQKSISLSGPPAVAALPDSRCSVTETVAVQSCTARSAACTAASSSAAASGSDRSASGRDSRSRPARTGKVRHAQVALSAGGKANACHCMHSSATQL